MTRLARAIDEVLADAHAATEQRTAEAVAIKVAAAAPRTELGRDLHALASQVRADHDDVTYADLAGVL